MFVPRPSRRQSGARRAADSALDVPRPSRRQSGVSRNNGNEASPFG